MRDKAGMETLKIMYLSPVASSCASDAVFVRMAESAKSPGTEVHVTSLPDAVGRFSHIEYRSYEALVTAGIVRAVRQAASEEFDAFVIGCFYDTALLEAREISGEMVVTAPCVASCEIAASLANRFAVIVGRRKWVQQMQATVHEHGYGAKLAGFHDVEMGVNDFQKDHDETARRLIAAGRKAVEEDCAEALILGCTMEVGFHQTMQEALGVPVIDPSTAALKRAEYAAGLKRICGWKPSRRWSCEAPDEAELVTIGCFDANVSAFGARIVVEAT